MTFPKALLPFLVLSLLNLIAAATDIAMLGFITKPLLMPALGLYFYQSTQKTPLNKFIFAALFFSFLGDTLLMFTDYSGSFFLAGLVAFLIAHIVYIIMNINFVNDQESKMKLQWQDAIFFLVGLLIFSIIKNDLGEMYIPTIVYTTVICIMGLSARKRWKKTEMKDFWWVMSGAVLFMVSDSILAINKFSFPFPQAGFLVMLTYLAGQYMLVEGFRQFIQKLKV